MKRITEEEHLKYFQKLVDLGVLERAENGKFVHVHHEWNTCDCSPQLKHQSRNLLKSVLKVQNRNL